MTIIDAPVALFSINLAILNLLPIPVLDGGHLVFLAIEAIRGGNPLSVEQRLRWSQVGFVGLMGMNAHRGQNVIVGFGQSDTLGAAFQVISYIEKFCDAGFPGAGNDFVLLALEFMSV